MNPEGLERLLHQVRQGDVTMRELRIDGGNSSSITWVINLAVFSSMPLVAHTNGKGVEK